MSDDKYIQLASFARKLIEAKLGYDIEAELLLCTIDDAPKRAKELYDRIAPDLWEPKYATRAFFEEATAMTVVGPTANAIIFRTDTDHDSDLLRHIMIHEYAHIFVLRNENGGKIIDLRSYSDSSYFVAGYCVWREFIASFIARSIDLFYRTLDMDDLKESVSFGLNIIANSLDPADSYQAYSWLMCDIMHSKVFMQTDNWDDFRKCCCKYLPMDLLENPIKIIYNHLLNHKRPCWKITEDFIEDIGANYILVLTRLKLPQFYPLDLPEQDDEEKQI